MCSDPDLSQSQPDLCERIVARAEELDRTATTDGRLKNSVLHACGAMFSAAIYPVVANVAATSAVPITVAIAGLFALVVFVLTFRQSLRSDGGVRALVGDAVELTKKYRRFAALARQMRRIIGSEEAKDRSGVRRHTFNEALGALDDALRLPLARAYRAAERERQTAYSPRELQGQIRGLLRACALLLDPDPLVPTVRAGLLLLEPIAREMFVPVVTFSPDDANYVSPLTIPVGGRPTWLIERFYSGEAEDDVARCSYDCLSDTDEYLQSEWSEDNKRYEPLTKQQKKRIKSILGVVLFRRENDGKRIVLGVISVDAPVRGLLQEDRYIAAIPLLRIIYRQLATLIAPVVGNAAMIQAVYGYRLPSQPEGVA